MKIFQIASNSSFQSIIEKKLHLFIGLQELLTILPMKKIYEPLKRLDELNKFEEQFISAKNSHPIN